MNAIEWAALNPQSVILGALCIVLLIISLFQARSRRQFEKRMLREQRILQTRITEEAQQRQESFNSLAGMLTQSASGSEERIRQASETILRTAQETQKLNRDIRENALQQQLSMQNTLDERLKQLQASNEARLEKINSAVDEKLDRKSTRLNSSHTS